MAVPVLLDLVEEGIADAVAVDETIAGFAGETGDIVRTSRASGRTGIAAFVRDHECRSFA